MAVPFLIMLTSSLSNPFDHERYSIAPRSIWSAKDRFAKGLPVFVNEYPGWHNILRAMFPDAPSHWTSWRAIGLDHDGAGKLAGKYLPADKREWALWRAQAADYSDFALDYPVEDSLATFTNEAASRFILDRYRAAAEARDAGLRSKRRAARDRAGLRDLSEKWGVPVANYVAIKFGIERKSALWQQSWVPSSGAKWADYNSVRHAIQHGLETPGVLAAWKDFLKQQGVSGADAERLRVFPADATVGERELWRKFAREDAPASPVIPYPMRLQWFEFLYSDRVRDTLKLGDAERFDIGRYNQLAGTDYRRIDETPFPLPKEGFAGLQPLWDEFVESRYPLRLTTIAVTPVMKERYRRFLADTHQNIGELNQLLGTTWRALDEVPLAAEIPPPAVDKSSGIRDVWMAFVKTLNARDRSVRSSETAYQDYLKDKYKTLDAVNTAYGWRLVRWEEARPSFDKAYAVTYSNHKLAFALAPAAFNYKTIVRFLLDQGNSLPVTFWLIALSILCSLTVNPLAGYALSRFNMRGKDKIILFCLATSAFPAMVSAIPGYLLMRDLGLLNTFFALVLPGAANGMGIFILKGFFDSLPHELYEAATIDGAREWQIFAFVTIPMVKPILAINALNAFMAAYNGWEWALIICQDKRMWTLSVWLYQANLWWAGSPWITTAGFMVASIPTLVIFLFCQKIIMRGIIVPSMK
ncbi:MAG: carbohydrate ABC transporter permease [Opitutaceae bacterium]|nr:carbohydrate ABC transporter permease [Opitutaceae bacterium]